MEVDIIVADYAAANERGKFTLVGAGITEIQAKSIPCIHSSMFLMARFKVTKDDRGKNRIEVRLIGEKGSLFRAQFDLDVNPEHIKEEYIPLPFHLQNTKFDVAGDYNFEVIINGQEKARQVLSIKNIVAKVG